MTNEYVTRQAVRDTARAILKDPILIMAVDAVAKAAPGVEVVRCKDCKHRVYNPHSADYWCNHTLGLCSEVYDTDFCSYGERRTDGK